MFFKRLLAFFVSLSLVYAPIANAQATAAYDLFIARATGQWAASTVAFTSTGAAFASGGAPAFAASTFSAGGTAISTAGKIAVGAGEAAIVVKGVATGANIFAAAKLLVMGGTGVVGIGLTALTMAPAVVDYFNTPQSRLGLPSVRDSAKPFEQLADKPCASSCTFYRAAYLDSYTGWTNSASSACSAAMALADTAAVGSDYLIPHYGAFQPGGPTSCRFYTKDGRERDASIQSKVSTTEQAWVPASMDDISPYMDAPDKVVTGDQFKALLDAGVKVQADPKVITGPAEILEPSTKTRIETPEKIIETATNPKTKLDYKTRTDPATGKTVPYVEALPSSTTTVTETDKATGVTKLVSTTTTEAPKTEAPKAADTPDLCALHPEIVACATVDQVDMCKVYPDSLACQKTDEPEVPDLEKIDKPITFAPDSGWGGGSGSCPAPRHLSSATGADFSFTPYCDFMSALRPVFIAVAWLSGAMILIGANRKE